jgi:hypothetical protein
MVKVFKQITIFIKSAICCPTHREFVENGPILRWAFRVSHWIVNLARAGRNTPLHITYKVKLYQQTRMFSPHTLPGFFNIKVTRHRAPNSF